MSEKPAATLPERKTVPSAAPGKNFELSIRKRGEGANAQYQMYAALVNEETKGQHGGGVIAVAEGDDQTTESLARIMEIATEVAKKAKEIGDFMKSEDLPRGGGLVSDGGAGGVHVILLSNPEPLNARR